MLRTKKKNIVFKTILEKELFSLQKILDTYPTQINVDRFQISKKELEHIENEEIKAHVFRSKIKWSEERKGIAVFSFNLENKLH